MEKLLQEWSRATAETQFAEAMAFCATPAARSRALYKARQAERRAAKIASILQARYGIDPAEKLRNGEIK